MGIRSRLQHKNLTDTGLSTIVQEKSPRMVNPDGSFNVVKVGGPRIKLNDTYHLLLTMPWWKFNLGVFLFYVIVNTIFACIYFFIGLDGLNGIIGDTTWQKFVEAFFFSAQTLTTVGYGRISPVGVGASTIAAIEGMIGLLGFALATGLLYGRFSNPLPGIMYSRTALITPFKGITALMFKIANSKRSELTEVEVQVTLGINELSETGKSVRKFYPMPLENNKVTMFPLSWTLVHLLNEESPMYGFTKNDLIEGDAEILIAVKGFDITFSQTIYSRRSYKYSEIVWGGKFKINFKTEENGVTYHFLNRISDYELVELPVSSAVENQKV